MTKAQLEPLAVDLWSGADALRANSEFKSSEYATAARGLVFLKCADNNDRRHEVGLLAERQKLKGSRREKRIPHVAIEKCCGA
jgi:type I restriction enzyme M protein